MEFGGPPHPDNQNDQRLVVLSPLDRAAEMAKFAAFQSDWLTLAANADLVARSRISEHLRDVYVCFLHRCGSSNAHSLIISQGGPSAYRPSGRLSRQLSSRAESLVNGHMRIIQVSVKNLHNSRSCRRRPTRSRHCHSLIGPCYHTALHSAQLHRHGTAGWTRHVLTRRGKKLIPSMLRVVLRSPLMRPHGLYLAV